MEGLAALSTEPSLQFMLKPNDACHQELRRSLSSLAGPPSCSRASIDTLRGSSSPTALPASPLLVLWLENTRLPTRERFSSLAQLAFTEFWFRSSRHRLYAFEALSQLPQIWPCPLLRLVVAGLHTPPLGRHPQLLYRRST